MATGGKNTYVYDRYVHRDEVPFLFFFSSKKEKSTVRSTPVFFKAVILVVRVCVVAQGRATSTFFVRSLSRGSPVKGYFFIREAFSTTTELGRDTNKKKKKRLNTL